jgi:uncharacterized protein
MVMRAVLCGLGLGYVLSRIGFTSWDETHRMFTFSSLRMFLAFAASAALLALAYPALRRWAHASFSARPIHPGTLPGGVLFGIGWALTGGCPGVVFAQLGEGQFAALATLAGVVAGNWLFAALQPRYFRWNVGSCGD